MKLFDFMMFLVGAWFMMVMFSCQKNGHNSWRLKKRKQWSRWGGQWCPMQGHFQSLTTHSFHKSEQSCLREIYSLFTVYNDHIINTVMFFLFGRSTKETTKPKSPELRVNQRGERSYASHMRWLLVTFVQDCLNQSNLLHTPRT